MKDISPKRQVWQEINPKIPPNLVFVFLPFLSQLPVLTLFIKKKKQVSVRLFNPDPDPVRVLLHADRPHLSHGP